MNRHGGRAIPAGRYLRGSGLGRAKIGFGGYSVDAAAEEAGDRVGDGSEAIGDGGHAVRRVGLVADEDYFGAEGNGGQFGQVDGELVHAYSADDRGEVPGDADEALVGMAAEKAVEVADGHDAEFGLASGGEGLTVADAVAEGQVLDQRYVRDQAEGGLEIKWEDLRRGVIAIEGEAGTDHVEVRVRQADRRGAVGKMADDAGWKETGQLVEGFAVDAELMTGEV